MTGAGRNGVVAGSGSSRAGAKGIVRGWRLAVLAAAALGLAGCTVQPVIGFYAPPPVYYVEPAPAVPTAPWIPPPAPPPPRW